VGASLLNAIEMPELIAQDEQVYEAKALYYAINPDAYQAMGQKLWDHRLTTPLFDSDGYVRAFEERMEQVYWASLEGSKLADINPQVRDDHRQNDAYTH